VVLMVDEELFRKAEPLLGERKARQLWLAARTDPEFARDIEAYLAVLVSEKLGSNYRERELLLPPPPGELAAGEYMLGNIVYGGQELHPFALRTAEIARHVGIYGSSGSGKSNALMLLCRELLKNNIPWVLFDWKRTARDMTATEWGRDITVFTVARRVSPLYFNPLQMPPNVSPDTWLRFVIQEISVAYYVGFGVANLLSRAFKDSYLKYGVYEAYARNQTPEKWPTFIDAYHWMQSQDFRGRMALWKDSADRCLYILTEPELRDVVNVRKPVPLERLLTRPAILEFEALPHPDKRFVIGTMLKYLQMYDLFNRSKEARILRSVIIIEEGHNIVSGGYSAGEEPEVEKMFREFRESGRGLVILDQNPSKIPVPILGNTAVQFALNLKHEEDLSTCRATMLLTTEQKTQLGRLPVGYAVVKLQDRHPDPFLIKFPLCPRTTVTDADLLARYGSQPEPDRTPEPQIFAESVFEFPAGDKLPSQGENKEKKGMVVRADAVRRLEKRMREMLKYVMEKPEANYRTLCKLSGLVGNMADRTRAELVARGFMEEGDVAGPHGPEKRFKVTNAGKRWLEPRATKRFGGTAHQQILADLAEQLTEQGWTVELERSLGAGKKVDLHVERDGRKVAVEVETGSAREGMLSNIKKCVESGYQQVWSVGIDNRVTERIRRDLALSGLDQNPRVRTATLAEMKI